MNTQHPSIDTLIDYIHGELAPAEDARMMAHLDACAACRTAYERETRLGESLRAHARDTERELPQGVVATIWDRVAQQQTAPSFMDRLRSAARPAFYVPAGLAAAAALVVAFAAGNHGSAGPTIDAAYYLNDHAAMSRAVPFSEGSVVPAALSADQTVALSAAQMTTADATR